MYFFTIGSVHAIADPTSFEVFPDEAEEKRYQAATSYSKSFNSAGTRYAVTMTISVSDYDVLVGYRTSNTKQAITDHRGVSLGTKEFRLKSAKYLEGLNLIEVTIEILGEIAIPATRFTIGNLVTGQVITTCDPVSYKVVVDDRISNIPVIDGTYLEDLGLNESGVSYEVTLLLTNADSSALWAWRQSKVKVAFTDHYGQSLGTRAFRIKSSTYVEGCNLRQIELEILRG